VEDNEINAMLACKLLERHQHRVLVAHNGIEALGMIDMCRFDLVFMDMYMPEMGGLEATQRIRKREAGSARHLPIIAMTANAMDSDRDACLAAGMDGFISKPINREQLYRVMAGSPAGPGQPLQRQPRSSGSRAGRFRLRQSAE